MKFKISNGVLLNALKKGGLAALSLNEVDPEAVHKNPLLRCVKIEVRPTDSKKHHGLTITSSISKLSSEFVQAKDVEVLEAGSICLDIQELLNELQSMLFPHDLVFEVVPSKQTGVADKLTVQVFNQKGRQVFGWSYDTVAADAFPATAFETNQPTTIKAKVENLKKAIQSTVFAISQNEYTEVFNSLAISNSKKGIFICATDNRRGALAKLVVEETTWKTGPERILVEGSLLQSVISAMENDEVVELIEDIDGEHLIARTSKFVVRMVMPASDVRSKFPPVVQAINTEIVSSVVFNDKNEFLQAMATSVKRTNIVHFEVKTGKDVVKVNYSNHHKPAIVGCEKIENGLKSETMTLGNKFLLDVANRIVGNEILMGFSPDEMRAVIKDANDPNVFYVMQRNKPMTS